MAQLAHNDYLEQASDSGLIGFFSFSAMVFGILSRVYRCSNLKPQNAPKITFFVWLGLVGLFLHSTVEFHLYYPAFAWTAFFLLGWMLRNVAQPSETAAPA
jgi:O-antigen ligase